MNTLLSEGSRIFWRNLSVKARGFERFKGNDEEICRAVIDGCFVQDKMYFRASIRNYGFYSRDFGWCIESLMQLGYSDKVHQTLNYALDKYSRNDRITVSISPSGTLFDFPDIYSPDSVAYLFRSLRVAKARSLVLKFSSFLNSEIARFEERVIDKQNSVVKKEHFSGMRDYEIKKGSCYDMIMACMLSLEIERINRMCRKNVLQNRLMKYGLKKNLIKFFWNGSYFKDSLDTGNLTGHCNVYPYWLGIISNKKMIKKSLQALMEAGLVKPFPLRYGNSPCTKYLWFEFLVNGWEHDTIWAMAGMAYIEVLYSIEKDKARYYLKTYKSMIEKHKAFIEVYKKDGMPYGSPFYSAETGMLWASMYLDMKRKMKVK